MGFKTGDDKGVRHGLLPYGSIWCQYTCLVRRGPNAFRRLQLAILEKWDDESIFAWTWPALLDYGGGLLAPSPVAPEESGDIEKLAFDETRAILNDK